MTVVVASPRPLPVPPCGRWDVWPYGSLMGRFQPGASPPGASPT